MFKTPAAKTIDSQAPQTDSDVSCDACGQSAVDGVIGTYGVFCEACVKPKTEKN